MKLMHKIFTFSAGLILGLSAMAPASARNLMPQPRDFCAYQSGILINEYACYKQSDDLTSFQVFIFTDDGHNIAVSYVVSPDRSEAAILCVVREHRVYAMSEMIDMMGAAYTYESLDVVGSFLPDANDYEYFDGGPDIFNAFMPELTYAKAMLDETLSTANP